MGDQLVKDSSSLCSSFTPAQDEAFFSSCLGSIRQHQKMDMASPQPVVPPTPEAAQKGSTNEN